MTEPRKDDPLKVACFLFDPNIGGPTIRSRQVSEALARHDVTVIFALPGTDGSARAYLEERGFEVHDLGVAKPVMPTKPAAFVRFVLTAPASLWRIVRFIRRERPAVIHVNGAFDILPALAGQIAGVGVLWHLNDMIFGPRLSRLLGRVVEQIATVPAVSAETVATHYGLAEREPALLRVPVDLSRYTPRQQGVGPSSTLTLLGNWNPLKGQQDFIDTLSALRGRGHNVSGRLAGRLLDSQRAYWEPIVARIKADPDLAERVDIMGFVDDVPGVLEQSDILLIPSISEAGPMSCVEAMAGGVPVVAYDVGDVRMMLDPDGAEPCGIVVNNDDAPAMADAVARLLDDPGLYAAISANGPRRARALYSTETAALATLAAYGISSA